MSIESIKKFLFPSSNPEPFYLSLGRLAIRFPHQHTASLEENNLVLSKQVPTMSSAPAYEKFVLKKVSRAFLLREYLESE